MKSNFLLLLMVLSAGFVFSQNKAEAEKMVNQGIALHDKGNFSGAITMYEKALALDKDNYFALSEKSLSLISLKEYAATVEICEYILAQYEGKEEHTIYINYGTALDELGKREEAVEAYEKGIARFPNSFMLHFNKGITLTGMERKEEAMGDFQKAVLIRPEHAGSHNAIGILMSLSDEKIPAILAFSRFMTLEPQSGRSKIVLSSLQELMGSNMKQTGPKEFTLFIDPSFLADSTDDASEKADNFASANLILTLTGALDVDKKFQNESERTRFARKFEAICSSFAEQQDRNHGFFWEYYVPYFIEMKKKGHLDTFSYIVFATSNDKEVATWIKKHTADIDKFFKWSDQYKWPESI